MELKKRGFTFDNNNNDMIMPSISFTVLMPTYNQHGYIRRAIESLIAQTWHNWELIIINDGSTDATEAYIGDYLKLPNVRLIVNPHNQGLGYSLNRGIEAATFNHIAYLPSDDFYDKDHLSDLAKILNDDKVSLAYTGIRYDASLDQGIIGYKSCRGIIPGYWPQLVQVAHKKTSDRWLERDQCVSEDLFHLFFRFLTEKGFFIGNGIVSCEWTNHPEQRHKICGEKYGGGLNKYRSFYHVSEPIRFRSSPYKTIDEFKLYEDNSVPSSKIKSLKILIVGELAYNPDRILALEAAGCELYGLWSKPRFGYSSVGPFPFGHIRNIEYKNWQNEVKAIKPDIIYALLSTSAIELSHEVLRKVRNIPFVWHFKESPQEAVKAGLWDKLIDLYAQADGCVFLNEENRKWIELFVPKRSDDTVLFMDGDMPSAKYFSNEFSEKLSNIDGEIHTVVTGRPVGISLDDFKELADNGVHLHIYSENPVCDSLIESFFNVDSTHIHVHPHCAPGQWAREFSKYDAGWLHCIDSFNESSLFKMTWADFNLPARISTYMVAGIPMIQKKNAGHIFAQRRYLEKFDVNILYDTIPELIILLKQKNLLYAKTEKVKQCRLKFSFDYNLQDLKSFFNSIINRKLYDGLQGSGIA